MTHSSGPPLYDATIVGDGIIGLSAALELARSGARCALVGASEPGGGSGAAAGILAPSVGDRDSSVRDFFRYSLDLFPAFLAPLREFEPDLAILEGLLEIVSTPSDSALQNGSRWLSDAHLRQTEPALFAPLGAVLHPRDGAIDSTKVLAALRRAVSRHPLISVVSEDGVARVDVDRSPARVETRGGTSIQSRFVVLAAGAWSPRIEGLPRPVPVYPLKGQIIALDARDVVRRPVKGDHIYLVPRDGELVVGATSEDAGFDTSTSDDAAALLHSSAVSICPPLGSARVMRRWAGLRPATADLLPILGPDPESPSLIYACGHSRNGILLAPATAAAIRAFVAGAPLPHPLIAAGRFLITRFLG